MTESATRSLRILLLAPDCNPESISTQLIGYEHAEALSRLHAVTLVVRARNAEAVRRAGGAFQEIESVDLPLLDRLYAWALRRIFRYDYGRQSLTAATYPYQIAFEWRAWRQLRSRIRACDFDVVLRILPIVPVLPSPFAFFLRNGPVPFVIGPLNGGLPWPKGFRQLDKQRHAAGYWVANLRGLYRYLPFSRSTYTKAAAIIAASSHTYAEFSRYGEKVFFVPGENGLRTSFLSEPSARAARRHEKLLALVFVGRLIPLKGCDLALRAAAPLLRADLARFTIVGDGPERESLHELAKSLGVENAVSFTGWLPGPDTRRRLEEADVLVFPSLREFGGTVVFEALALGTVPVVADFGGPGDIVDPRIGYKIPLVNENDMVSNLESILNNLAKDRTHLNTLRREGIAYARQHLTWDSKARSVTDILRWAIGSGSKPDLLPPKRLASLDGRMAAPTARLEAFAITHRH
jgi:glycosyltransferase involved in cell wall biosynthesis